MPRVATLSLRSQEGGDLLAELARVLFSSRQPAFVSGWDLPLDGEDPLLRDEIEAFVDWDVLRGDGRGFFLSDRRECATRRVDLRGPTDLDPGPLPMEEGPPEESPHRSVVRLVLAADGS